MCFIYFCTNRSVDELDRLLKLAFFLLHLFLPKQLVKWFNSSNFFIPQGPLLKRRHTKFVEEINSIQTSDDAPHSQPVEVGYIIFPPHGYVENGVPKGLDVDIWKAVISKLGIAANLILSPSISALPLLVSYLTIKLLLPYRCGVQNGVADCMQIRETRSIFKSFALFATLLWWRWCQREVPFSAS